jgi:hypothetical protein
MEWECKYCGRYNPWGEYVCLGCGGPRRERTLGEWGEPMGVPLRRGGYSSSCTVAVFGGVNQMWPMEAVYARNAVS